MAKHTGTAPIVTTTCKHKGKVYRSTHLLHRSYREGQKIKNETLGNLSPLPEPLIDSIRRSLQGEHFIPVAERVEITTSPAHGHVQAVISTMERLGPSFPARRQDVP